MSRDNTRRSEATTASFTSIGHSSVSNFDPEGEAIASTGQIDSAHREPKCQNTRKQRVPVSEEPDYAIDTSALERAFPEFSQVPTSEEEEDVSIEVGRGPARTMYRLDDSRNSLGSLENSVRSASPAVRLDHISQTPMKPTVRNSSRRSASDNLRKDAQLRRASLAQEAIDSQVPRSVRKDQRRTFSDMHTKARETYDGSLIADERPLPVSYYPQSSTRFGRNNISHQIADAVERASQEVYAQEIRRAKLASTSRTAAANGTLTTNTFADTLTHRSFIIPDLPNLSDLVSGVYDDGNTAQLRQRARSTRFVSPPDLGKASSVREYIALGAVPIPEDEKALFVSLRLLQDKVAELELAKTEAEKRMEEMRQENAALKASKERHQEKHDRLRTLGDTAGQYEEDGLRAASKNKWEAANLALQNGLDILDRKCQTQEAALEKLGRERDIAVTELGAVYMESRELKNEIRALKQEISELKAQASNSVSSRRKPHEGDAHNPEETSNTNEMDANDNQIDARRGPDVGQSAKEVSSRDVRSSSKSKHERSAARIANQVVEELKRLEKDHADEELFSLDLSRPYRASAMEAKQAGTKQKTANSTADKKPNTGKHKRKRVIVQEFDITEPLEPTTNENAEQSKASPDAEEDLTMLSFMDPREIAQLRKTLEQERLARKQRQPISLQGTIANETSNTTRQSSIKAPSALLRKSAFKEAEHIPPRPASAVDFTSATRASATDEDSHHLASNERRRRHSDQSGPSTERRRRRNVEDMTSAFILPDITIRHADAITENLTDALEIPQKELSETDKHDKRNCTVCKRCIPGNSACQHAHDVKVLKPIPVSQRRPELSAHHEEFTLRPAQAPAAALATVLKALEDELSHLKMHLTACQSAYNHLDASAGKRKRKSMREKIERLFVDIDMKSDQIYALYDVLEGQKLAGQEMTEQEMEGTLQSIGIPIGKTRTPNNSGIKRDTSARNAPETDSEEDVDENLPWEGFESTVDVTSKTSDSQRN